MDVIDIWKLIFDYLDPISIFYLSLTNKYYLNIVNKVVKKYCYFNRLLICQIDGDIFKVYNNDLYILNNVHIDKNYRINCIYFQNYKFLFKMLDYISYENHYIFITNNMIWSNIYGLIYCNLVGKTLVLKKRYLMVNADIYVFSSGSIKMLRGKQLIFT